MASPVRKTKVKEVPLSEVKDDLSRFLREAETQDVVITRHGKPAGVLSVSNRRTTGLTTDLKTIRGLCNASNRLARASVSAEASNWKTSNNGAL